MSFSEEPPTPRPSSSPEAVLPRARSGETILLVEDHEDVIRFGASALEWLDPDVWVLGKPYTLERLAASVREAIDRGSARRHDPVG
jgi:hypothetical protein